MSKNIITLCEKTICHFRTILNKSNSKAMLIGVKGGGCDNA
jgi:Fe-S cluster assembly iron-binding protein IscA